MKKVLLLLIVLAAVIGAAVVVEKRQNASLNTAASTGVPMRELLLPELDTATIQKVRVKDKSSEVNVTIAADRKSAAVAERGGYPASLDKLNTVFTDLAQQKIASKSIVRKGAWAEIDVNAPGEGTEGVGTLVEFSDAKGAVAKSLVLGKDVEIAGGRSSTPFSGGAQRYVRIPADGETIWAVSNTFYDLDAKPESWVDKAFVDVQKIKQVTVTHPKPEDSWSVSRPDEQTTDYKLEGAKEGESFDSAKVAVGSLLSSPSFNDVHPKDKAAELMKDATKAKLVTFDGFTYDVQVAKQAKDGSDKYYLTVSVTADLPKARTPEKDEKEEDKKKKDEEFLARKKTLEEKLAKEQKFAGWVYEVSEYTVNNLLKKRSEVVLATPKIEEPPPTPTPTPAPAAAPVPAPAAPRPAPSAAPASAAPAAAPKPPPVTVTTPPVSVTSPPATVTTPPVSAPPMPKEKINPTPDPKANPATGATPASAPAPASTEAKPAGGGEKK